MQQYGQTDNTKQNYDVSLNHAERTRVEIHDIPHVVSGRDQPDARQKYDDVRGAEVNHVESTR